VAIDQAEVAPAEAPATPAAAAEGAKQERAAERQSAPATSRREAAAARNKVELVGTLERVTPGNRPGTPTRLEVEVTNGNFKDTLAVSAFREAGESAKELEPGSRVAIDGYLAIRKVERDGQSRTIASVTANAIEAASPGQPDRNYARVVGNVAQEPRFREGERGPFAALSVATGPEKFADIVGYGSQATEIRDTLGRGDGIAVEGRVRPQEGRDGFPASVQVVANEIELEHKKQPRLELEGRLTRDPQIGEGPKATRVAFSIAINEMVGGKEQTEYKNVVAFADKGAAWPSDLKKGTEVRVTGREDSSPYEKDGEQRTFEFVRADRVERVERERSQDIGQSAAQSAGVAQDVSGAASDKVVTEPEVASREAAGVAAEAPEPADAAQLASVELPTGLADAAAPAVELHALARQIARTDWTFAFSDDPRVYREGAAAVNKTLASVAESARLDADGTRALIERFAAQNGEQSPDVVHALRGAVDRGLGVEAEAPQPTVDLSHLPVFTPGANDVVDRREDFTLSMDQTMTVSGRSEDGQRVFGRDGGGVLSVSKVAFTKAPSVDEDVTISRIDGKDQAQVKRQEVALER